MLYYNTCAVFAQFCILSSLFAVGSLPPKPEITINRMANPPGFEDFENMRPSSAIALQMSKISGFIQQQPSDGKPASQKTEVYAGYDQNNLHLMFIAFDNEADQIRATKSVRENLFHDDQVEIMIDTFNDERRAYAFVCNPFGIQWDAIWTEGQGFDDSFDTIWSSEGKITDKGYLVRMQIPFKSLRFNSAQEQTWGVIFLREIRRNSEQVFWPRVSSAINGRLNQAGIITGLRDISPGRNFQVIPYITSRAFRLLDDSNKANPRFINDNFDATIGLDAKVVIKDKFTLDLTFNPDFNQVESDRPQVTANQRFEIFFPEKRPFFLENANYLNNGLNLVFTRRIGEPNLGLRLTGKSGPLALGALIIDDNAKGKSVASDDKRYKKQAYFSVARIQMDIGKQSNAGLLFTNMKWGDTYNRVVSFDTRAKLTPNWFFNAQAAHSFSDSNTKNNSGTGINITLNRNGRQLFIHNHFRSISPNFKTEIGFIPRNNIIDLHHDTNFKFRPEGKFLIAWGPEIFLQKIWATNALRLDETITPSLEFEFHGQNKLEFSHTRSSELLFATDYSGLSQNKRFRQNRSSIQFQSNYFDAIGIETGYTFGTAVNFNPIENGAPEISKFVSWNIEIPIKPTQALKVENEYFLTRLCDEKSGAHIFTDHLFQSRWSWQLNRKLSLRVIFDYNANSANEQLTNIQRNKNLNADFLITYLVNPWTALYVGANRNYRNIALENQNGVRQLNRLDDLRSNSHQFFVKYSHLFRM